LSEHLVISIADCIFRKIIKTDSIVTGKKKKKGLKIILIFASGRREIQARHKDLVKVTLKFIRRGICF
jgi:hypothetical protein